MKHTHPAGERSLLCPLYGFGRLLGVFSLCEEVCVGYLSLEVVVLIESEQNMSVVASPLAFSLAELGQCRSVARQLSQMETRSRGCCT